MHMEYHGQLVEDQCVGKVFWAKHQALKVLVHTHLTPCSAFLFVRQWPATLRIARWTARTPILPSRRPATPSATARAAGGLLLALRAFGDLLRAVQEDDHR